MKPYTSGLLVTFLAVLGSSDYYWNTWAFQATWPNFYMVDFNVPPGTKRKRKSAFPRLPRRGRWPFAGGLEVSNLTCENFSGA